MPEQHPIVIIGSGLAAYMLAKEFRKLDTTSSLMIITANDGRFYSKPLLSTALAQKKEPEVLAVATAAAMGQELKAVVMTHTQVISIDPPQHSIELANQEKISYSKLILACGAEVLRVPLQGDAVNELYSVNDLEDYARFRSALIGKKKIAILGSGLVGCEFANDLTTAGFAVSLIAPDSYPLQRLVPPEVGHCLAQALLQAGSELRLGQAVTAVDRSADGYRMSLSSGGSVEADLILSAVGLKPTLSLAKGAGLATRRGIVVDSQLQTSHADIYALGDCAEVMGQVCLYVAPLLQCARVLAQVLANQSAAVHYPLMPIVVKTSLCPIVVQLPPEGVDLEWKISGEELNYRALAYHGEALQGFALSGVCVKERVELLKRISIPIVPQEAKF